VLFSVLKRMVGRRRPCSYERQCWHSLLPPDHFSFPSGHSITAFATVGAWAGFYPQAAAGLYFCALSVAASRVVLGMHYLSDVVAGCLIGAALGRFAFLLFN
jgi:undecaprenyl-diphosphatase